MEMLKNFISFILGFICLIFLLSLVGCDNSSHEQQQQLMTQQQQLMQQQQQLMTKEIKQLEQQIEELKDYCDYLESEVSYIFEILN